MTPSPRAASAADLRIVAATPDRWEALATLFGPRGACEGCWCTYLRLTGRVWDEGRGEVNRERLRALVASGSEPGVLAFDGPAAVGWCAVAPRDEYPRLLRSKPLQPIDDRPAWAVTCFFTDPRARSRGVARALLRGAIDHARRRGAQILEGYPRDPAEGRLSAAAAWHGTLELFLGEGFTEVARRSRERPIVRLELPIRARHGG